MREGWDATTLGEVAEVFGGGTPSTKVDAYWNGDIPWVTPTEITANEGGVVTRTERTITEVGLRNSGARLLPAGTVLLTSRATIGAVALAGIDIATNQGFAALVPGPRVLPRFLMFWCQSHKGDFIARAGGNTFLEVSKTAVRSIPIVVPPLDVQGRIVDLITSLDAVVGRLKSVEGSARTALDRHLDSLEADGSLPLGSLVTMGSGPSWKADQETELPVEGAMPVIGITNTKPDGRLDVTTRRYVAGLPTRTRRLKAASLVMIRTNGNRDRIGNVYRVVPDAVGSAVSAFQIALDPAEPEESDYIFWCLRAPNVQRRITMSASGTTGLGNIAVRWLRELEIEWPSMAERAAYVELAEALYGAALAARDELSALRLARSSILAELLAGDHAIPLSYDTLLDAG
jgi:restriction endonuclease S subunit